MSINIKEGEDFSDVPEGYYTQIIHCVLGSDEDPIEVYTQSLMETLDYIDDAMDYGDFRPTRDFPKELHPSKVFLLTHGNDDCASGGEVHISNSPFHTLETLNSWLNERHEYMDVSIIHLQEYESFEMAYEVALAMREGHPLCYNK